MIQLIKGYVNGYGFTVVTLPLRYTTMYTPVPAMADMAVAGDRWSTVGGAEIMSLQEVKLSNHSSKKEFYLIAIGI